MRGLRFVWHSELCEKGATQLEWDTSTTDREGSASTTSRITQLVE